MKNTLIWIVIIIVILVSGFFLLNSFIYQEKQPEGEIPDPSSYFQERMITLGVQDIGQPIEGFDASLLIMAFPGLEPSDFNGVKAYEGYYEAIGDQINFVRTEEEFMTSAERTIPEEGYAILLENISRRLSFPTRSHAEVDELIEKINTGERIETQIDRGASALGVKIIPHEVLEDSRCPVDVACVQAGTVRLRATLESGLGTADQVFELNQTVTTESEEVILVNVFPLPEAGEAISLSDYSFYFEIKKR